MKILIVRHAPAKNRLKWAESGGIETQRPLTKKGVKKMQQAVKGLHKMVEHVDVILSSTLERSIHTATLLCEQFGLQGIQKSSFLEPGVHPQDLLEHLRAYSEDDTVVLVGHEPDLSELTCFLTAGEASKPFLYFRKGGAALLECEGLPFPGRCSLTWFVTREMLEAY